MDIEQIRKLVELMEEKGVVELEVEDRKGKVRLVRENHRAASVFSAPVAPATPPPVAQITPPQIKEVRAEEEAPVRGQTIVSPMVGTFYRAPSPEAGPYVEEGSMVERGQVLCIIEAMKIMNEIEAEFRGRIVKVLVENGQPVEYGQPLFLVEPLEE